VKATGFFWSNSPIWKRENEMREFFKTSWTTKQDTNRSDHYCAVALKFIIPYTLAEIRELFLK
jgi:hypothetical protein